MSDNPLKYTPDNVLVETIKRLKSQVRALKTNQNSIFIVPGYTSDPSSPIANQMWTNTTSHTLKIYINGVVKTVTLT